MDNVSAYWDPLPTARRMMRPPAPATRPLFGGVWEERNWLNVPGPFYGATTDNCTTGRGVAPELVGYNQSLREFVFRQPRSEDEVDAILQAADEDPFGGYGCDGDDRWTVETVRAWWADRARVREWARAQSVEWLPLTDEPGPEGAPAVDAYTARLYGDAAAGLRDYVAYIDGELGRHLRGYLFWLDQRREPRPGEALPHL
ncbi:ferredoxin [Streptomycetaceae bacterium NBC_01309]